MSQTQTVRSKGSILLLSEGHRLNEMAPAFVTAKMAQTTATMLRATFVGPPGKSRPTTGGNGRARRSPRLSQLCPPCATPFSNSSLDYRRSDARIVENGFAASSGVSKSAKVVLGRVLINPGIGRGSRGKPDTPR
jgi:hypothetical protein